MEKTGQEEYVSCDLCNFKKNSWEICYVGIRQVTNYAFIKMIILRGKLQFVTACSVTSTNLFDKYNYEYMLYF